MKDKKNTAAETIVFVVAQKLFGVLAGLCFILAMLCACAVDSPGYLFAILTGVFGGVGLIFYALYDYFRNKR